MSASTWILALGMFAMVLCAFGEGGRSVIEVVPTAIDFGAIPLYKIREDKNLQGIFKFTNKGDKKLKIEKIATSCGCASAKPTKEELEPGESTDLTAHINLEGKFGKNTAQILVVFSNGDVTKLEIQFNVEIGATLFPIQVHLEKSEDEEAKINATAYLAFPFPIAKDKLPKLELSCEDPRIKFVQTNIQISKIPNELNGHYYCTIDFEGYVSAGIGDLSSNVVLIQEGVEVRRIPIIVRERKDVSLRRDVIYLGVVKCEETVPIKLEIDGDVAQEKASVLIEGLIDGSFPVSNAPNGRHYHLKYVWINSVFPFIREKLSLLIN